MTTDTVNTLFWLSADPIETLLLLVVFQTFFFFFLEVFIFNDIYRKPKKYLIKRTLQKKELVSELEDRRQRETSPVNREKLSRD